MIPRRLLKKWKGQKVRLGYVYTMDDKSHHTKIVVGEIRELNIDSFVFIPNGFKRKNVTYEQVFLCQKPELDIKDLPT